LHYEDGPKNPLKSIPVKRLVPAFFAQIRVGAGYEFAGLAVMAYRLFDPSIRGDLSMCKALDLCTA